MSAFTDKVRGNWNVVKGKLKQQYADLTDDDLMYQEGREDEFLGNLEKKTGQTKDKLKSFIDSSI